MTNIDLDGLAALAQAATPGPWVVSLDGVYEADMSARITRVSGNPEVAHADAAFIAACDPDTILALVERAKDADRQRAAIAALADKWEVMGGVRFSQLAAAQELRALLCPPTADTNPKEEK
jgi:hypothetical protein